MKALTLSEYYTCGTDTQWDYSSLLGLKQGSDGDIEQYNNFLNQKFKHELITELFEGWGYGNNCGDYYKINKNDNIEIFFNSEVAYLSAGDYQIMFPLPKTLGDFILFCQYAGIELEYKEKKDV